MKENVVKNKSLDFAVRIVNLYTYLSDEFRLELLVKTGFISKQQYNSLQTDCAELNKILISTIKTSKNNLKNK